MGSDKTSCGKKYNDVELTWHPMQKIGDMATNGIDVATNNANIECYLEHGFNDCIYSMPFRRCLQRHCDITIDVFSDVWEFFKTSSKRMSHC